MRDIAPQEAPGAWVGVVALQVTLLPACQFKSRLLRFRSSFLLMSLGSSR